EFPARFRRDGKIVKIERVELSQYVTERQHSIAHFAISRNLFDFSLLEKSAQGVMHLDKKNFWRTSFDTHHFECIADFGGYERYARSANNQTSCFGETFRIRIHRGRQRYIYWFSRRGNDFRPL